MNRSQPHHTWTIALAVSLSLAGLAGCSETSPQSGVDDSWVLGGDSGTSDAGVDSGSPADTEAPPVDCGSYEDRSACRAQSSCRWEGEPCSLDPDDGRCVHEDLESVPPHCPREPCAELDEARCKSRSKCGWFSKTCPDGSTVGTCGGPADGKPILECPTTGECAERAPERCGDGQCSTVTPGCGEGNPPEFDGETCLPSGTCDGDADCGDGLTCMNLMVQPDCDRCGACATGRDKCVPEAWANTRCRELSRDRCRRVERCGLIWPSQCNEEAPAGAETLDEPTCFRAEPCAGSETCDPRFKCETVWEGCPPNANCASCGRTQKVCVPDKR
ncbi:MAG: hypothetical protein ABEN55_05505 [Bradymonadaceae bacterium]